MNIFIKNLVLFSFVLSILCPGVSAADLPSLRIKEPWRNVFAGQTAVFTVINTAANTNNTSLLWRLSYNNRTLAQGTLNLIGNNPGELKLPAPPIENGITIPADLSFYTAAETTPLLTEKFTIFPAEAFAEKKQWLSDLKIALYDPDKTTQEAFEKSGLPFQTFSNIEALPSFEGKLFIVGQNTDFSQSPELWNALRTLAKRRIPVLILAPQKGHFELTTAIDSSTDPAYEKMILSRKNIIRSFDKNLDTDWGSASTGLKITSDEMTTYAMVDSNPVNWTWLELSRENSGTMIICGFDIVSTIERSPAPRYFLSRLIDYLINSHSKEDLK